LRRFDSSGQNNTPHFRERINPAGTLRLWTNERPAIDENSYFPLWEGWQNPETQEWLRTCTIITGQPNELVAEIHTRMSVILPPETHDRWLAGDAGKEILLPFPAEAMKIRAVSRRLNKPENNDPGLLEEGEMEQVGRLI
jgi:hypothetical protein